MHTNLSLFFTGTVIATQLLDVTIRVQAIRQFAVNEMSTLLETFPISTQNVSMFEVLYAAAWIVGEFVDNLDDPVQTMTLLLRPMRFMLPGHIQAVYVQNIIKIFMNILANHVEEENIQEIKQNCQLLLDSLPIYLSSSDIEVQERASSAFVLIQMLMNKLNNQTLPVDILEDDINIQGTNAKLTSVVTDFIQEMNSLFSGDLNPVAPKAQRKVQLPDRLNLDEWINTPPSSDNDDNNSSEENVTEDLFGCQGNNDGDENFVRSKSSSNKRHEPTVEELARMKEDRRVEQRNNPNYLKSLNNDKQRHNQYEYINNFAGDDIDDIPVAEIALEVPLEIQCTKTNIEKIFFLLITFFCF
jgi:AP-3 complex subunit delta